MVDLGLTALFFKRIFTPRLANLFCHYIWHPVRSIRNRSSVLLLVYGNFFLFMTFYRPQA